MFSPFVVQVAVALLAVFSVGGVMVALLYPRLAGGTRSEKRLETIAATKLKAAGDRISTEEGRRRRSVEDTLTRAGRGAEGEGAFQHQADA